MQTWKVLFSLLLCASAAWTQSTFGSIVGTVVDPSGAAVAGASVTAQEINTGIATSAISGKEGFYEFLNLKPGQYAIAAAKAGFAGSDTAQIALEARQTVRSDLALGLEGVKQSVTVREVAPAIDTEDGTIVDSKNFDQITQLPLNFRALSTDPLFALSTVPGAQLGSQRFVLSLGGGITSQVEFSIDGISNVGVGSNSPILGVYPSPEALAEFKVTSTGAGAEFGQKGDVAVVTRGGTNQLHGSALWYHQNAALDAKTYAAPVKQAKVYNTFGGSLGGPVVLPGLYRGRDRTFFYVDYEGNRQPGSALQQVSVPTAGMRRGNLAGVPGSPAVDPLNGLPFPDNVIPATRINSVAAALFKLYYPLPNYESGSILNNYRVLARNDSATDRYDLRVDHRLGAKQQLFARWSWDANALPALFGGPLLPASQFLTRSRNLVISHDYTLSPNWVNEFRFGLTWSRSVENFPIRGVDAVSALGIQGLDLSHVGDTGGFPYFGFDDGYFGSLGHGREQEGLSRSVQFTDNITRIKGRHTWKFGLDARLLTYGTTLHFGNDDFGQFSFRDGAFSGNAFADLLLGLPAASYYAVIGPNLVQRTTHTDLYAQDQWQASKRLTLTLGLRWEFEPPMTEDAGNISNFNPRNGDIIVPDHTLPASPGFLASANACPGTTSAFPCTRIVTASQAGIGQGLLSTHYDNWAPRFGFAYRPFRDNRTVFRGAAGLYVGTLLGPSAYPLTGIHTSDVREFDNYQGPGLPPAFTFPQSYGGIFNLAAPGNTNLCCVDDPNLRNPHSIQWNFSIERALPSDLFMRVSYVGSQSAGLLKPVDLNQVPASTAPYSRSLTPYPVWKQVFSFENLGFTNYQSLQTEVSRRFRAGMFFQAAYTLAKELGNAGNTAAPNFPPEAPFGGIAIDRFDTRLDRGNFGASRRHRFVLSGIFPVPVGNGRRIANRLHGVAQMLAGGWDVSMVTLLQSGPYQTPVMSTRLDQSNTNLSGRSIFAARPDRIADGNLPNPTPDQYYDIAAFVPPPAGAGRFGNAGAGILRGPGTIAVAAGLSKTFAITERARLRMEGTFTNLPNHPNFLPPGVNISNPIMFGKLTTVQSSENSGNRTGQLGVRLEF